MDAKPKRRWFRFRLSTVLILTAIAAWGMSCRPWIKFDTAGGLIAPSVPYVPWNVRLDIDGVPDQLDSHTMTIEVTYGSPRRVRWWQAGYGPTRIVWPCLALAAFLAWKTAWAVVERRRRQSAAPE
jgi:hypothetical protein